MADEIKHQLPDDIRQQKAVELYAQYVKCVTEHCPPDIAAAIFRNEIQLLGIALGEHAGHINAADWLTQLGEKQIALAENERASRDAMNVPRVEPVEGQTNVVRLNPAKRNPL